MTVLNTLRQNRKHEKLIILGGSEGAVIANLLAAQLD
jgi:alpha-beta hydrolase superfamily lysophospholipase